MRAWILAGLLGLLVGTAPVRAAVTWACERKNEGPPRAAVAASTTVTGVTLRAIACCH